MESSGKVEHSILASLCSSLQVVIFLLCNSSVSHFCFRLNDFFLQKRPFVNPDKVVKGEKLGIYGVIFAFEGSKQRDRQLGSEVEFRCEYTV
jgi:hypothetical protein